MAPYTAIGPTSEPPTLCAQFQIDIIVPRSDCENQWVMIRPHGGQPMPLNQPTRKLSTPISTRAAVWCSGPSIEIGTIMNIIEIEASTSPSGRNLRASLRSETAPIRNLESA